MRRKNRKKGKSPAASDATGQAEKQAAQTPPEDRTGAPDEVKVSGWVEGDVKATPKAFPDPRQIDEPVRVAMTAEASAEMVSHAKESLEAEVCGVLVGELCEDQQGIWVSVKAAIRGTSAKQGGAHVTYTQETWDKIYEIKDRDYPKLKIVGWYHSHPGFGVELSEMDRFIQKNFFSGPAQLALVLDPISGDQAVGANAPEGFRHVSRFWVNGRECSCRLPQSEKAETDDAAERATGTVAQRLRAVEERLQQVLQATDEERNTRHNVRMTVGMLLGLAIVLWISFMIYDRFFPSLPKSTEWGDALPVMIGDEPALLGVRVVRWKVPARLHHKYRAEIQADIIKQLEEAAKKLEEEQKKKEKSKTTRQRPKKTEQKKQET